MSGRDRRDGATGDWWYKRWHTPDCFKCHEPFGEWRNEVTMTLAGGRLIVFDLCDVCCDDLEAGALDLAIPWDVQTDAEQIGDEERPF